MTARRSISLRGFALRAAQAALLGLTWCSGAHAETYDPAAFASLGVLQPLTGTVAFNTDAATVEYQSFGFPAPVTTTLHGVVDTQRNAFGVAVFRFDEVSILGGVGISVVGSRPLALLSSGSVLIGSDIDVSGGPADEAGPGGGQGGNLSNGRHGRGDGGGSPPFFVSQGGGGGGFGGIGGQGEASSNSPPGGQGGRAYGDLRTSLEGGSGGGGDPDLGGGGGGAIEVVAHNLLALTSITARGGRGNRSAGGGSGGGIVLAGDTILFSGAMDASGADSASGGSGGGGRILIAPGSYIWGTQFATDVAAGTATFGGSGNAGVVTLAPRLTTIAAGQVLDLETLSARHPFANKPEVEFLLDAVNIAAGGIGYATSPHNAMGNIQLAGGLLATAAGFDLAGHALRGNGNQVGKLHVDRGALLFADGGHLAVGDANVADALLLEGGIEIGSHSTLVLNQAKTVHLGSKTRLDDGSRLVSINGAQLDPDTLMEVDGEADILGTFINQGRVRVAALDASLTFLNDVHGAGSFAGTIVFRAAYSPGNSPATIDFGGGDAQFDGTSELTMEIAGSPHSGAYDRLTNIDTLDFRGLLKLVFTGGFTPAPGAEFDLFDFNHFIGSFAPERIVVVGFDITRLDLSRLSVDGKLSAVPLPGMPWPMASAAVGIVRRRRSCRKRDC